MGHQNELVVINNNYIECTSLSLNELHYKHPNALMLQNNNFSVKQNCKKNHYWFFQSRIQF